METLRAVEPFADYPNSAANDSLLLYMKESMCSHAETGELRGAGSKLSGQVCSQTKASDHQDTSTPSSRQLMCSQNRAEIEAVKEELTRAGIATETRNNATAEALGVTGVELWVKHERDYSEAADLFAKMQTRARGVPANSSPSSKEKAAKPHTVAARPQSAMARGQLPGLSNACSTDANELQKLEEDTSFLEKQIEEMLDFQREVVTQCVSVRGKAKELRQALAGTQAAIALENETRATAQRKHAEEISGLQNALQNERADRDQMKAQLQEERAKREQAAEQLRTEKHQWQQQLLSQEETLRKAQEKLELQARLLQTHTAAVLKLTKEVALLEAHRKEDGLSITKLREDIAMERKARMSAEERAENAAAETSLPLPSLLFRRLSSKRAHIN